MTPPLPDSNYPSALNLRDHVFDLIISFDSYSSENEPGISNRGRASIRKTRRQMMHLAKVLTDELQNFRSKK